MSSGLTSDSVDISAHRRLRKLRKAEDETTISGTAYSKRLRTQYVSHKAMQEDMVYASSLRDRFEKLAGQPEWAVASSKERRKRKKRRTRASESESSESESESEDEQLLQRTGETNTPTDFMSVVQSQYFQYSPTQTISVKGSVLDS